MQAPSRGVCSDCGELTLCAVCNHHVGGAVDQAPVPADESPRDIALFGVEVWLRRAQDTRQPVTVELGTTFLTAAKDALEAPALTPEQWRILVRACDLAGANAVGAGAREFEDVARLIRAHHDE
jgi:hypothetical protein